MTYSINYEANKENENDQETKQNNQVLSVVDLYSLDPTKLEVSLSSVNFKEGNYPDLAKHKWVIRTHNGFYLNINFEIVEMELDIDTISVYKFYDNGEKELVDQINFARQLLIKCNQVVIVFRSDCTVNKSGFQAAVKAIRKDIPEATTTQTPTTLTLTQATTTTKIIEGKVVFIFNVRLIE